MIGKKRNMDKTKSQETVGNEKAGSSIICTISAEIAVSN